MAENYTVNYNINVNSEKAISALTAFQNATSKLTDAQKKLTAFQKKIDQTINKFNQFSKKAPVLSIKTDVASRKLDTIIRKLEKIDALASKNRRITISTATSGNSSKRSTSNLGAGSQTKLTKQLAPPPPVQPSVAPIGGSRKRTQTKPNKAVISRGSASYRALGPSMLDSGGISAVDMLKGMGIAYGITGLGTLMGDVITSATEYNNLITTTKNILKSHDSRPNFDQRFSGMERVIRNVGVETKYTASEVADASKFLAMAGFNLDDINKSIRPIADIALIGDTGLGETADVVTNIMTGYGIPAGNVRHAADVMTQTFTMSNTTLMEIAESYKYAASLLANAGVSFEEATAGIGILGDAGIKGSQAGTSLRTILANIVNPTKKQLKVWEQLGVERFDKNGNLRDLVDIFTDLHNANMPVSQIYQMFNRTAAQGAVSLIANVDKWNEIVKQNFLSEGITEELANAKKNTIQGLWAQLTSMFTEDGMKAFESLDGDIRKFLQETIDWLQTNEAEKLLKSLGSTFLDLMKMIKDFTMVLVDVYNRFGPFIKIWVELQLKLSAVLVPLRIFRAMFYFGEFLIAGVKQVGMMANQFTALTSSVRGLVNMKGALATTLGTIARMGGTGSLGSGLGIAGSKLAQASPEVLARYTSMQRYRLGNMIGLYSGGIGGMAGSMLGSYYGSDLGEPGSSTSMVGAIAGALGGGAIGSFIGSKVVPWAATTALPFLLTNPLGWGVLLAGGLATAAVSFWKYKNSVDVANDANNKFLASTASINGINMSEHATQADKYLSLVYSKQMDVNRSIGEHINLMREQLGLMSQAEKELTDKKLKDQYQDQWNNAYKAFSGIWQNSSDKKKAALSTIYLPDGSIDVGTLVKDVYSLNANGKSSKSLLFNGVNYEDSNYGYSQIAAARFLYGLGRDISDGSELAKIRDSYNKRFLMSSSLADFNAVLNDSRNALIKSYLSGSQYWAMSQLGDKPESEWKRGYHYVTAYNSMVNDMFAWNRPEASANAQMLNDLVQILKNLESGNISNDLLSNFMLHSGIPIFDAQMYGKFGSDAFMKNFGWYNSQWNAGSYQFFNVDTGKMESINVTADEARQAFLLFHQQIIDLTNRLNPKLRAYFDSFIDSPIWKYGDSGNGANGKAHYNGTEWTWDPIGQIWTPNSGILRPMSNAEMQRALSNTAGNPTGANVRTQTAGVIPGPKASDYKSHYNNTAAPKQVNVTIKNLMNVESIDLSNPDNAAVIANLKSELTQALVDVVHDFDETWNG